LDEVMFEIFKGIALTNFYELNSIVNYPMTAKQLCRFASKK